MPVESLAFQMAFSIHNLLVAQGAVVRVRIDLTHPVEKSPDWSDTPGIFFSFLLHHRNHRLRRNCPAPKTGASRDSSSRRRPSRPSHRDAVQQSEAATSLGRSEQPVGQSRHSSGLRLDSRRRRRRRHDPSLKKINVIWSPIPVESSAKAVQCVSFHIEPILPKNFEVLDLFYCDEKFTVCIGTQFVFVVGVRTAA